MIRVALDATPLIGQQTGVGAFTDGVIRTLAQRDDTRVVAYAVTWRGRAQLGSLLPTSVTAGWVPMAARPLHRMWARLDGPVVEWWTGPIDVVHGTNFVVPPTGRAAALATVHDLTFIRFPELCEPATLRFPALIRRALDRGAWIHTHTHAIAHEVIELLGAPAERVRVVPPGIDVEWLASPAADAVRRWAPTAAGSGSVAGEGRPYLLALGRVEPRKDLPGLVRAFDALASSQPDLDLVIAGPAGWGEDAVAEAIRGSLHRDRISRVGWLEPVDKAALLRRATVFAYPSVYEGFGLPPLEAMAAGVPVVATAAGGLPEAVGDAARLVPVGDSNALAGALVAVLDDAGERARLIAAGHHRVAGFTWERCAAGLHAIYCDAQADRR